MSFRFVDIDHPASDYSDFAYREPRVTLLEMWGFFMLLVLVGTGIVITIYDRLALISILFTTIGIASYYAGLQVHRSREKRRATELLNSLLASALGKGCRFCLIAHRDGRIMYGNPEFNALFAVPREGYRITAWLEGAGADSASRQAMEQAVTQCERIDLPVTLQGRDGCAYKLRLFLEPIERPQGFILLRARDDQA